jgi:stage V sporulation protein K
MQDMIGLGNVRTRMKEISARMEFDKNKKQISSRHMVFLGPAGTGKTTVARIYTGFLYKNKMIKKNKCLEVDGNFLKAGNPADSAVKTKFIIQHAYGGVLFIDEAYSLMDGYCGNEVITTLIKEMEDNKDRFVLILAGYTREMQGLLRLNTGFSSRIKDYLEFPDYNTAELRDIFRMMAGNAGFAVEDNAYIKFDQRMEKEKKLNSFGNGRTVRNVLDEAINRHALNFKNQVFGCEKKFMICQEDIQTEINKVRI